jgi:hypothetical protein
MEAKWIYPFPWDDRIVLKKLWRWSKGVKSYTFELKSSWSRLKNGMKSMHIKHEGM